MTETVRKKRLPTPQERYQRCLQTFISKYYPTYYQYRKMLEKLHSMRLLKFITIRKISDKFIQEEEELRESAWLIRDMANDEYNKYINLKNSMSQDDFNAYIGFNPNLDFSKYFVLTE